VESPSEGEEVAERRLWREDLTGTGNDQTTTYTYGTTKGASAGDSKIATGHLLWKVQYPDSLSAADVVTFAYNAQGEMIWTKDQKGRAMEYDYDDSGRRTHERVTTDSGFDTAILRLSTTYDNHGRAQLVSSYYNATVGGGTPNVQYSYAGTSTSNYARRTAIVGDSPVNYNYGATGGINDYLSRIQSIVDGNDSSVTADYTYLGSRNAVRLDFADADVMLDLWGGTSGQFDGLDRFGRIIDQRWLSYSGTPTDLDRYQYGYDRNSNRLWKQNMVATSGFDEQYTMDAINRLTQMKRGTLDGSHVITGTPGRQQDWTLDSVGNWPDYVTATSGTTDLDQSRTSSVVNEITAIGTNTGGLPVWATPGYDAAGNMTAFLNPSSPAGSLTAIYDAWNRLVAVKDGSNFIAEYAYDGLKRRVVKRSYTGGVLQETRDFYLSDQWQVLSEAVSGTTDNAYAWGLRYVDELLWRVDGGSARQYAMQDANFNCTAICDGAGSVLERYQFDPYGNRTVLNASWTVIGTSAYAWVIGHQSLMLEVDVGLYNCRNRVYLPLLGCWMQRDPFGYADGMSLYEYERSQGIVLTDPYGLASRFGNDTSAIGCGIMGQTPAPAPPCLRQALDLLKGRSGSPACKSAALDELVACCNKGWPSGCARKAFTKLANCNMKEHGYDPPSFLDCYWPCILDTSATCALLYAGCLGFAISLVSGCVTECVIQWGYLDPPQIVPCVVGCLQKLVPKSPVQPAAPGILAGACTEGFALCLGVGLAGCAVACYGI